MSVTLYYLILSFIALSRTSVLVDGGGLDSILPLNTTLFSVCGGAIESDSDSVSYNETELQPGDICVWTIHLNSRMGFSLNFSEFNVRSQYTDCRDGGIRIYALTNLAPPNEAQSYTFCNGDPPPNEFFLGYTVLVVILYVGNNNTNPGTGFKLNWSGSSVDPLRTKHISTYSTASEALIKYPVVGTYPTSVASTWLMKPTSAQVPTQVDLFFSDIHLESCTVPGDPCGCDSIILFQVGASGHLNETRRMCGQESGATFYNLQPRFIIAFFTDLEDLSGGEGFMATYYSGSDTTTEWGTTETTRPTTTRSTTTERWQTSSPYPDTPCGEIVTSEYGAIAYKNDYHYDANERCVWTIRSTTHTTFNFEMWSYMASGDHIYISTFNRQHEPLITNERINSGYYSRTVSGSVAVITFATKMTVTSGMGFTLYYQATGPPPSDIATPPRDVITELQPFGAGNIRHPSSGQYRDNELSIFAFAPPNFKYNGRHVAYEFVAYGFEETRDDVDLYKFSFPTGWHYERTFDNYPIRVEFYAGDLTLLVFHSDQSVVRDGFQIHWEHGPSTLPYTYTLNPEDSNPYTEEMDTE